ncbi:hypothetical protein QAD02_001288 [Eretmocerus hayati]|uniref:Uncharacterized protein n=1 Tax=Eretmocerus hayati TaxID=131215 RepID=A0ACC2NFK8_9HYME|nr:hypothetical protein QAD02_001288 [Eretmocerus hayati]
MMEFFGDEEIANYKNIFSLPTRNLEKYDFDACLKSAVIALAGLARFTKLFDTSYDYTEIKKLMKNDLAVFVGALLAKYAIIITSRCAQINLFDPDEKSDEMNSGLGTLFPRRENSSPLNSLSVLGQFTILNCIPNVMKTYTHNNKFIAFALHPIKKGEKLTSSVACMYQRTPKLVRQAKYQKLYNRPCDCQACTENWFETPGSDGSQGIPVSESDLPTAREILDETHAVFYDWDKKGSKLNHPDIKLLTRASNVVEKAWVHFPPPSPFSVNALIQLMKLSFDFYQPAEEYSEFSEP